MCSVFSNVQRLDQLESWQKISAQKCLRSIFSFKANVIWTNIDETALYRWRSGEGFCAGSSDALGKTRKLSDKLCSKRCWLPSGISPVWASVGLGSSRTQSCSVAQVFSFCLSRVKCLVFFSGWVPISALNNFKWHKAKCQIKLECFYASQSKFWITNSNTKTLPHLSILAPAQRPHPISASSSRLSILTPVCPQPSLLPLGAGSCSVPPAHLSYSLGLAGGIFAQWFIPWHMHLSGLTF